MDKAKQRYRIVERGEDLTIVPVNGIYNQPLFDLCADDSLLSFTLMGAYNPALDAIGFETSDVYKIERNMITYVGPDGTAAASPTSSDHTDACAPGNGTEFGGVGFRLEGWGRMRRSSVSRDITDVIIKYCEQTPIYDIGGKQIKDDYEWDVVQLTTVLLQDMQRRIINGSNAVSGQADGLAQLVAYGYTDPRTGNVATAMDSVVVDYANNEICPEDGATNVEVNGVAVADGFQLYHFIASFLRRTQQRIKNSPNLTGAAKHIGLIPTEHLNSLIECWVCYSHCGGDKGQMFEADVQVILNKLKAEFSSNSFVTLTFHGVAVDFFSYDYGLITSTETEEDGCVYGDIYILTTDVGNTPLLRIQMKDMKAAANHIAVSAADLRVTDKGRFLSWSTVEHTCFRNHAEFQWRVLSPAPWAQMKIENVCSKSILGAWSADPLSAFYFESNLVKHPKAVSSTFTTQVVPVAVNDFYTRVTAATVLNVAAGSGLLVNDTGTPTPTVTAVTGVATTAAGTITILADGSFAYTPPSATFAGVDTYVYTITNAAGSDTATLTITSYVAAA